jgi:hypothetical protein
MRHNEAIPLYCDTKVIALDGRKWDDVSEMVGFVSQIGYILFRQLFLR